LADPALGTDCRHDAVTRRKPTRFSRNNPKIFLLGHTKIRIAVNRKQHYTIRPNTADICISLSQKHSKIKILTV
jgi:hypothetical protein